MLVFTGVTISFFVTSQSFSFITFTTNNLGLLVMLLMSAIGSILLTALLHGEILPVLSAGVQYWLMQPVYYNMLQINAFANADDISWGTKNLDKSATHEGVKTQSKKLAYRVRPSQTSRAYWQAMGDLHAHLVDQKQVKLYNARKEAKLRAFASYLLIAWVGTNVLLVGAILAVANYEWDVCAVSESQIAVSAIQIQATVYSKALAIADLVQTAVTILQRGSQLYPFNGLQGFPQAYPILVSGDAQSDSSRGARVTVLANATDLFNNLDQSMPTFQEWLAQAMGINSTATLEEYSQIWLPMPGNTTGFDTSVTCRKEYGYKYYLQAQFLLLLIIIGFQIGGSFLFLLGSWWRRFTAATFGSKTSRNLGDFDGKIIDSDDEDDGSQITTIGENEEFEVSIQPSSARFVTQVPPSDDIYTITDSGSYTPTSESSAGHRALRRQGGSPRYID